MNNPIDMIKQILGANGNPKEFLIKNMLGNMGNPMLDNLISMANNGDSKGVELFAKNICRERGIDFNKEFQNFMQDVKR